MHRERCRDTENDRDRQTKIDSEIEREICRNRRRERETETEAYTFIEREKDIKRQRQRPTHFLLRLPLFIKGKSSIVRCGGTGLGRGEVGQITVEPDGWRRIRWSGWWTDRCWTEHRTSG